jgi:hypothetical protein
MRSPSLLILLFAVTAQLCAAEVLLNEDFEKLDLKALPADWQMGGSADLSIVDEAGRSKVLKISHKGGGVAVLDITIDPAKVAGTTAKISIDAKFAGKYQPIADKAWARPKCSLVVKDKAGKELTDKELLPEPEKPEWQKLTVAIPVSKEAASVVLSMKIQQVEAEVLFDDLKLETEGAIVADVPKVEPPKVDPPKPPAAKVEPPKPTPKDPKAKPVDNTPQGKSPEKTLEDGGVLFNPGIAKNLTAAIASSSANKNTVAFSGPGLPNKDLNLRAPEKWNAIGGKEFQGAPPRALLVTLPDMLVKDKPEVVILFGDGSLKPTGSEQADWEDLARLCLRFGAIPVLAIPAAPAGGEKEAKDVRASMIEAAVASGCPAIDLRAASHVSKRIAEVSGLLEKHVYARLALDAVIPGTGTGAGAGNTGAPIEE